MPGAVATVAGGTSNVTGPLNVCKVPAPPSPPVPTPFGSSANLAQAMRPSCSLKVTVSSMPALVQGSTIPMTLPVDAAGTAGGVVSGTFSQEAKPTMGSMKVKFEGKAVVFQTCTFSHNKNNAPTGIQDTPSQMKVIVMM